MTMKNSTPQIRQVQNENWEVIVHLSHSPDLVPSDFYLFGTLKPHLSDKRFEGDNKLQDELRYTYKI